MQGTYIAASPTRVWECLTTAAGWDAWFTQGARLDVRPGGEVRLRWDGFAGQSSVVEDGGPVLHVDPGRSFSFEWCPSGRPTRVHFELRPRGDGTSVILTESGYGTSPKELDAYVSCATGWGEALTLLKFWLEHGLTYGPVPPRVG